MRSRMFARLLPAALAAAAMTAIGAPAVAQEAPPPAEETHTEAECAEALKILSYFKLLPDQPDVGRTLCSMNEAKQQDGTQQDGTQQDGAQDDGTEQDATHQEAAQQDQYTNELDTEYTTETGQTVEDSKLLGVPVEWPKSLTVHVPTINDRWHSYTSTKN